MGLKKRSKVNAQFNMSSLTDIIFLLLIFFMLTSSLVIPNALNLKLPGKSRQKPFVSNTPTNVTVAKRGTYYINGRKVSLSSLDKAVKKISKKGGKVSITVTPNPDAPNEKVVAILDIAFRYGVEIVLLDP